MICADEKEENPETIDYLKDCNSWAATVTVWSASLILTCARMFWPLLLLASLAASNIVAANVLPSLAIPDILVAKSSNVAKLPESDVTFDLTTALLDSSSGLFCFMQKVFGNSL